MTETESREATCWMKCSSLSMCSISTLPPSRPPTTVVSTGASASLSCSESSALTIDERWAAAGASGEGVSAVLFLLNESFSFLLNESAPGLPGRNDARSESRTAFFPRKRLARA